MNNKDKTILEARSWIKADPLFLDTETTGLHSRDEVIELSVIDLDGNPLLNTLVCPTVPIHPDAQAVHHITAAEVQDAPSFADVWPALQTLLDHRHVVIYNARFDLDMLMHSRMHLPDDGKGLMDMTACCAMTLFSEYYGEWNSYYHSYRWQSLEKAARHFGVPIGKTHRALDDAQLARLVLLEMAFQPTSEEEGN